MAAPIQLEVSCSTRKSEEK